MPADPVLSRELNSLHEEIAALRRGRISASGSAPPLPVAPADGVNDAVGVAAAAVPPQQADEARELRDQLAELADQVSQFFEQAEANIAAHPAETVVGALVVGILIGRLVGRR